MLHNKTKITRTNVIMRKKLTISNYILKALKQRTLLQYNSIPTYIMHLKIFKIIII